MQNTKVTAENDNQINKIQCTISIDKRPKIFNIIKN
jgi:hypothetical protein